MKEPHKVHHYKLDRRAWIVLALEVSENAVRGNHELRTPQLFNVFEIFDHTSK